MPPPPIATAPGAVCPALFLEHPWRCVLPHTECEERYLLLLSRLLLLLLQLLRSDDSNKCKANDRIQRSRIAFDFAETHRWCIYPMVAQRKPPHAFSSLINLFTNSAV
jgi:hypothetical protein